MNLVDAHFSLEFNPWYIIYDNIKWYKGKVGSYNNVMTNRCRRIHSAKYRQGGLEGPAERSRTIGLCCPMNNQGAVDCRCLQVKLHN